jgi:hypothetical protein
VSGADKCRRSKRAQGLTGSWSSNSTSISPSASRLHSTAACQLTPKWHVSEPDVLGRIRVKGEVDLIVRVLVGFGGEFGMTIDEEIWRRSDGSALGAPVVGPGVNQLSIRELED